MPTPAVPKKAGAAPKSVAAPKTPATTSTPAAPTGLKLFGADRVIPTPTRGGGPATLYPFADLEAHTATSKGNTGFEVEVTDFDATRYANDAEKTKAFAEAKRKLHNKLTGAVRRFNKANPDSDKVFTVRSTDGGVGVWRTK